MVSENLCKFPAVMKEGFKKYNLDFKDGTEWTYDPVWVYRMVFREKDCYDKVTNEDFLPFAVKPRRGMDVDQLERMPDFYGTSVFITKDALANKLKLPRPGKKIAAGHLFENYGPIYRNNPHICLWVYKDTDFSKSDFLVCDYE